jgi:hypothetical protein
MDTKHNIEKTWYFLNTTCNTWIYCTWCHTTNINAKNKDDCK